MEDLKHWFELYQVWKYHARCVDIEMTSFNGKISMIGVYTPVEGVEPECETFIRNKNLNKENLKQVFEGCKLIIVFNGLRHDIPKIRKQFPGVIPNNVPILDLYSFARKISFGASLKTLEQTFFIERITEPSKRKGKAIWRWKRWVKYKDFEALKNLIEYNKQDTINLFPLANDLMKEFIQKYKEFSQEKLTSN